MKTMDYRYTACGLENVVLQGLPVHVDDAGETVVRIPHVNQLHRMLALEIATKEAGLQAKEIRFLRTEMGLTQAELARVVGKDAQTVGRWERGETAPDQSEEMVIRVLALQHIDGATTVPPMDSLASKTTRSAADRPYLIDASDPPNYKPVLEAA